MLGLALALALSAGSETGSPVEEGVRLYEGLQFERAALMLKQAAADSSLSDSERARANLYLGLSSAQLLDESGAREAFARAAEFDPKVRLPGGVSPKVERIFRQALDIAAKRAIHVDVSLPTGAVNGELIPISVLTTPPGRVNAVRVFLRKEGEQDYKAVLLDPAGGGTFRGKVQARSPALEVYVEADAEGARRAMFAAPETPARIPVSNRMVYVPGLTAEPPPPPPVYQRWYFWGGIGAVVVVGAGVAAIAYASTRGIPCGAGNGSGCLWININNP